MESEKKSVTLPNVGDVVTGTVVRVYPTYAILLFDEGWTGLLHISELSHSFIRSFTSFVTIGTIYSVKVISVDQESGRVHVSLKQVTSGERKRSFAHKPIAQSEISFDALRENLPGWIKEQNDKE
ncbi:MAG: S1 RNA-binding domain-containing protein [Bacilli bacterium]|nr:S1 RNA-binding domain-containing protein [Bacilli bacterium]